MRGSKVHALQNMYLQLKIGLTAKLYSTNTASAVTETKGHLSVLLQDTLPLPTLISSSKDLCKV